jgi:hypothetical protein
MPYYPQIFRNAIAVYVVRRSSSFISFPTTLRFFRFTFGTKLFAHPDDYKIDKQPVSQRSFCIPRYQDGLILSHVIQAGRR